MKRRNTIYNCDLCEKQHTGGDVTPLGWVELNCPRPGSVDEFQDRWAHVCAECVGKITNGRDLERMKELVAAALASTAGDALVKELERLRAENAEKDKLLASHGDGTMFAAMFAAFAEQMKPTPEFLKELHPATRNLVFRFAKALAEKLAAAEKKYGFTDGWTRDDWQATCLKRLAEHVEKGDPRDVAAYCAFAWHHGWSTSDALADLRAQRDQAVALARELGEALQTAHTYIGWSNNALVSCGLHMDWKKLDPKLEKITNTLAKLQSINPPTGEGDAV